MFDAEKAQSGFRKDLEEEEKNIILNIYLNVKCVKILVKALTF